MCVSDIQSSLIPLYALISQQLAATSLRLFWGAHCRPHRAVLCERLLFADGVSDSMFLSVRRLKLSPQAPLLFPQAAVYFMRPALSRRLPAATLVDPTVSTPAPLLGLCLTDSESQTGTTRRGCCQGRPPPPSQEGAEGGKGGHCSERISAVSHTATPD